MGKLGEALKSSAVNSANLITLNDKDLKRMQDNLYAMLIDIKDVCKKENIKWGLIAGSLLGAVRYNDFIPWDDDIDIYMLRSEYERFKSIFNKELGDKYVLKQPGDPNYIFHFPQIQKKEQAFSCLNPLKMMIRVCLLICLYMIMFAIIYLLKLCMGWSAPYFFLSIVP